MYEKNRILIKIDEENKLFKIIIPNQLNEDEEENYIYRFVNYCKVVNELRNIDLFFVFRMHDYLTEDEILFILKELSYKKCSVKERTAAKM